MIYLALVLLISWFFLIFLASVFLRLSQALIDFAKTVSAV